MKQLKLAAVALMALSVAMVSCTEKETTAPVAEISAETPALNIRYINVDTVLANYTLAQEVSKQNMLEANEYQALESSKSNELQQEQNRIAQKYQSGGYLSESSLQSDQQKLEQRYNQSRNLLAQRYQAIGMQQAERMKAVQDSLHNYLTDLARVNGFTAILDYMTVPYIDPSLDITQAVIEGLNQRYKPAAAPAAEAKK